MRLFFKICFFLSLFACETQEKQTANIEVPYTQLQRNPSNGYKMYNGHPFTGKTIQYHPDGTTVKMKCNYLNGLKHGEAKRWYSNGSLNYTTQYIMGRKHGITKVWYKNGQQQRTSNYYKGVVHGKEITWYPTGEKQKERILVYGQEEGMQKAWRKDGKIYANYQAINGRIFGLLGTNMCYKVTDEKVEK